MVPSWMLPGKQQLQRASKAILPFVICIGCLLYYDNGHACACICGFVKTLHAKLMRMTCKLQMPW